MRRHLLLATGLIIATLLAGFGLYYVFFRTAAVPPLPPATQNVPLTGLPTTGPAAHGTGAPTPGTFPTLPTIAQGGATQTTKLSPAPTKGGTLMSDGKSIAYYNTADGKFYRSSAAGEPTLLSGKTFFDVKNITWAPDAKRAVLEYPDGAKIMFDFDRQAQVTLPKHWQDFGFSPDGSQIIAKSMGIDVNNRWLVVANPDGTSARAIAALGENANRVSIAWSPKSDVVAFSATGEAQGFDTTQVIPIGANHENFAALTVEGRDFRPLWTPDGSHLLYSVYNSANGYRPTLWLTDASGGAIGGNRRAIGIDTWADKCTFAGAAIAYCAVPTALPDGAGLQPAIRDTIPDQVYRIDVAAGTQTLVGSPADPSSLSRLSVSSDGTTLYYTETVTGLLRKMQLR